MIIMLSRKLLLGSFSCVMVGLAFLLASLTPQQEKALQATTEIHWMSFEEAVAASEKNPKKILIDVYTSWCGWCKKLDKDTYQNPRIVDYVNKHYYAVKLNAEMKDTVRFREHVFVNPQPDKSRIAHELALSLLQGEMTYPSTLIMDEGFNLPTKAIKGYIDANQMLVVLQYFGENAYKHTNWAEYQKKATAPTN